MDAQPASPWRSVWLKPGPAIQHIVAANPRRHIWLLGSLSGICSLVVQLVFSEWRTVLLDWRWLVGILLGGAILGIVGIYLLGLCFRWSGRLLAPVILTDGGGFDGSESDAAGNKLPLTTASA